MTKIFKVPKRKLSYGELLDNLNKAKVFKQNKLAVKKMKAPKHPKAQRHEFSYGQVVKRIRDIQKEE